MTPLNSPMLLTGQSVTLAALSAHPAVANEDSYRARLSALQLEMLRIQRAYYREGRRALLVFEGWDAAGKGGAIRRLTSSLDPRGVRVIPIGPPTAEEQGRHYLWRFWQHLPVPGALTVLDRSYYGRVLVERVDGLATAAEWGRAYAEINEFERLLHDDSVRIVKCFLHITADEQLRRFRDRLLDPDKRWKLTLDDIRNHTQRPAYEAAIEAMLTETGTTIAPWHLFLANHKWHARVAVLETVVAALGHDVDTPADPLDPIIAKAAREQLGIVLDEGELE